MKLEGVYSVLPTPFTASGDLDLESLKRVVDLFIGAGVNGLTALGVTSEVARMNDGERVQVLETVVQPRQRPRACGGGRHCRRCSHLHRLHEVRQGNGRGCGDDHSAAQS